MTINDRPLFAGMCFGLLICLLVPCISDGEAWADDHKIDSLQRRKSELKEQLKRMIGDDEDVEIEIELKSGDERDGDQGRMEWDSSRSDREMEQEHGGRGSEVQRRQRQLRARETTRARQRIQLEQRQREPSERERSEIERDERIHQERIDDENRARAEREHAFEREVRELEIRRHHLELRRIELELEQQINSLHSKSDEAALDAIELARGYMEPEFAVNFLADLVDGVRSPRVSQRLRMQLAELYFRTDQPDKAAAQLRQLILPRQHDEH